MTQQPHDEDGVTERAGQHYSSPEPTEGENQRLGSRVETEAGQAPPRRSLGRASDDVVAARAPGEAWLARWPLAAILALVGVVAGLVWASTQPVTYTSEARVAVGAGDLSAGAIAGFPEAAEALASNYARYINDQSLSGSSSVALSASPIPDSSVIRVDGVSTDSTLANREVQKASKALVSEVKAGQQQGDALAAYVQASQIWSQTQTEVSQAQAEVSRLRAQQGTSAKKLTAALQQLTTVTSAADVAQLKKAALGAAYNTQQNASTDADLQVVVPATIVADNKTSLRERYALIGGVLGLALSLVVAVLLERRGSRRHRSG